MVKIMVIAMEKVMAMMIVDSKDDGNGNGNEDGDGNKDGDGKDDGINW